MTYSCTGPPPRVFATVESLAGGLIKIRLGSLPESDGHHSLLQN